MKINEIDEPEEFEAIDNKDTSEWGDSYDLKKIAVEVHSIDEKELNKDFTLSNLTDTLFQSRVIRYIMKRIALLKRLEILFPFAYSKIERNMPDEMKMRIYVERNEYKKIRKVVLSEIKTILVMSRARGGVILKSFLGDNNEQLSKEIAEVDNIDAPKRTFMDKVLGRNRRIISNG